MRIILIFLCFLTTSCATLELNGHIVAVENDSSGTKNDHRFIVQRPMNQSVPSNDFAVISETPFFKDGTNLRFAFNQRASENLIFMFVPIPLPPFVFYGIEDDYTYLSLYLIKPRHLPEHRPGFLDEVDLMVTVDGMPYFPERRNGENVFYFPVRIRNLVSSKNVLIIDYKGVRKEIPFEYRRYFEMTYLGNGKPGKIRSE